MVTDMELSGTSETAREAFVRAIRLLSECDSCTNNKAEGETATARGTVAGARAGTEMAETIVAGQEKNQLGASSGGTGEGNDSTTSVREKTRGSAHDSDGSDGRGHPTEGSTTADPLKISFELLFPKTRPLLPRPSPSSDQASAAGGEVITAEGRDEDPPPSLVAARGLESSSGCRGTPAPPPSPKDEALVALTSVIRGLESRFVTRAPPPPLSKGVALESVVTAAAGSVFGRGEDRVKESIEISGNSAGRVGVGGSSSKQTKPWTGGGWSVRVRPPRAEELLADLLERETVCFAQVNRDGARALERWVIADGDDPPPFFIAPAMMASTAPVAVAAAAAAMPVAAIESSSGIPGRFAGTFPVVIGAGAAAGNTVSSGFSSRSRSHAADEEKSQRRKLLHFPLNPSPLNPSAPGLGQKSSVFSMMLCGASLLGRHETAVLLAVRCGEHFLDAFDLLASPRGPLSVGGGRAGSPARSNRKGYGVNGNEGLGAVSFLLTSREPGADRREVDAIVTSACAEFLAHAIAVAVWAVPHVTRRELFGDGGSNIDDNGADASMGRAVVRKTSVLRCLARLMRHSVDNDNTRVRDKVQ